MDVFNFSDPVVRANPYPYYAELRRKAPITKVKMPYMGEVFLVTRYEDVVAGHKHPLLSSEMRYARGGDTGSFNKWWVPKVFKSLQNSMVLMDDPGHRRLRDLVHIAFTPRRVEQIAGRVGQITDHLLDQMAAKGRVDLIADFALPIPLTVISDMMGVPEDDRLRFHRWSAKFLEVAAGDPITVLRQFPNGLRMQRFFEKLIRLRRIDPRDDLLTALVNAESGGDRLSEDELLSMIFLLLLAGHETTVNLISTGVLTLLEFPDQLRLLRAKPDLIDSAIEELLRYGNPVEHGNVRYAMDDLELAGYPIPKGSSLILLLASANRDETIFENPDSLDIMRYPNRQVGFGFGVHYCLGAPLARLEGRIAIQKLVQRFPDMRLAVPVDQLAWRPTTAVRGLKALPMVMGEQRTPAGITQELGEIA